MAVSLASNQHGPQHAGTIGQYSKQSGGKVQVPCLDLVKRYNTGMDRVDLLDRSVTNYRVDWRHKSVQVENKSICI